MPDSAELRRESPEALALDDEYSNVATQFVGGILRGRSGFGALRHHDGVLRETARGVFESGNFAWDNESSLPMWSHDPEFWHYMRREPSGYHRALFEGWLAKPQHYEPRALWALFWALARAEHEFLFRFVPFWSHEERLTGHLVSQMVERIAEYNGRWRELDSDSTSACHVWYADTAAAGQESTSGADLGLVVHGLLGGGRQDFIKVARLQAKKVGRSGSASIDLDQLGALHKTDGVGYYLFYHYLEQNGWNLAPTVRAASDFSHQLERAEKHVADRPPGRGLGRVSVGVRNGGLDLASFVTFHLADVGSEVGVLALDPQDAVRLLFGGAPGLPAPTRVMVMTLGGPSTAGAIWPEVMREYVTPGQTED